MKNVILTCLLTVTVISLSFAQLKVVAPDGDVGIGITSPDQKLHVKGITRITPETATAPAALQVGAGRDANGLAFIDTYATTGGWMGRLLSNAAGVTTFSHQGAQQFQLRTFGTSPIWLVTGGVSRLTVDGNNGNVGIGTNSPTAMLHVNGAAVKPGGGTWGTASDKRLKDDVAEFTKGLDAIMKINPVTFVYNGKAGIEDTETVHTGVIAQEFQKVSPESIFKYKHTQITTLDNDEGFKTGSSEEYLGVDPSQITYMLVNAVKELQAQIDEMSKTTNTNIPSASDHVYYSTVVLSGEEEKALLSQNAPNPFTTNTKIDYFIPSSSKAASMSFTDITGKEVKRVNIDHSGLGTLDVSIADMPMGIYSYSLVIDGSTIASMKMVLSK